MLNLTLMTLKFQNTYTMPKKCLLLGWFLWLNVFTDGFPDKCILGTLMTTSWLGTFDTIDGYITATVSSSGTPNESSLRCSYGLAEYNQHFIDGFFITHPTQITHAELPCDGVTMCYYIVTLNQSDRSILGRTQHLHDGYTRHTTNIR